MGQVWKYIEQHRDSQQYGTSVRAIARAVGIKESTLPKWQHLRRLPEPEHLRAVARHINVPYRVLLEAALIDTGYLKDDRHGASITDAGGTPAPDPAAGSGSMIEVAADHFIDPGPPEDFALAADATDTRSKPFDYQGEHLDDEDEDQSPNGV